MGWLGPLVVGAVLSRAPAEDAPVLVVTHGPAPDAIERRIEAELRSAGFTVERVAADPDAEPHAGLQARAREHGAAAAIGVTQAQTGRVEIWLVDRMTGKASVRVVEASSDEVVAVRVVELLEASLLELSVREPTPEAEVEPPPAAVAIVERSRPPPTRREPPGAFVGGGPWLAGSPDALRPTLGVLVQSGVAFGRRRRFALSFDATASLLRSRNHSDLGTVVIGVGLIRAHALLFALPSHRVSPVLGIGGGLAYAWAHGEPTGATPGRIDGWAAAIASAHTGLAIVLASSLRLRAGIHCGLTSRPLAADVAGERVVEGGRPLLDGTIALEWITPR